MLPWYWPKEVSMEGGRIDVTPEKKTQITSEFTRLLGSRKVQVLDVEEICNSEFHIKYEK